MQRVSGLILLISIVLTGCGKTSQPVENQTEILITPKLLEQEKEITECMDGFVPFILTDNVTMQECYTVKLPKNYKIAKVKKIKETMTENSFMCIIEAADEVVDLLDCTIGEMPATISCTAMQIETPTGFKFTIETSNRTYDSFIWEEDSHYFYGEFADENSIILQKLSDNTGWYQDSNGYHFVITFDCGSLRYNAETLEELKEVVNVMIG